MLNFKAKKEEMARTMAVMRENLKDIEMYEE